jgi:hypothetical protein
VPTILAQRRLERWGGRRWRYYGVTEKDGILRWVWILDDEQRLPSAAIYIGHAERIGGVPEVLSAFDNDAVTADAAEEITGLTVPVCWDKLRDLM